MNDALSVILCHRHKQWFCNMHPRGQGSSHAVQHIVDSGCNAIAVHNDNMLGNVSFECYHCGSRNVFQLGFIPRRDDQTNLILYCRQPCLDKVDAANYDLRNWMPLISNRAFVAWLARSTSDEMVR